MDIHKANIYFDYYGEMLTEKQKQVFEYYYKKDYSLNEISKKIKISRQAVYYALKGAHKNFLNLEEKLNIIKMNNKISKELKKIYLEIKEAAIKSENQELKKINNKFNKLITRYF